MAFLKKTIIVLSFGSQTRISANKHHVHCK